MAPVTHIVLITFLPTINPSEIAANLTYLRTLKDRCIHPSTGKPYMLSLTCGADLDAENMFNGGFTHALCMVFASKEDLRYYSMEDPVHTEFVNATIDTVWSKWICIDIGGEEE